MLKIPENKTRKRFRIAQCIFYALLVMLCSMPYIQGATTDGKFFSYSVLDLMSFIGGTADGTLGDAFLNYVMYTPILIIIPVIGFFFCLFDRERNIKKYSIFTLLCGRHCGHTCYCRRCNEPWCHTFNSHLSSYFIFDNHCYSCTIYKRFF